MKKFALLLVVVAFGASFVVGCPGNKPANTAGNTATNAAHPDGEQPMLTYDQLKQFVAGDIVAIRGTATLEPAGVPGDKIFPPTHAVDDKNTKPGAKYACETRRIGW